jgi:hypothetical protein
MCRKCLGRPYGGKVTVGWMPKYGKVNTPVVIPPHSKCKIFKDVVAQAACFGISTDVTHTRSFGTFQIKQGVSQSMRLVLLQVTLIQYDKCSVAKLV